MSACIGNAAIETILPQEAAEEAEMVCMEEEGADAKDIEQSEAIGEEEGEQWKREGEAARRKLIHARSTLILRHPFFASLALCLTLHEDRECRNAWTDGGCLAYNPSYINVLGKEKLLGLVAHLVMHPACGHHLRRQGRDFAMWNEACDYAINWILEEAGFTLPDSLHSKEEFRGLVAEDIYAKLAGEPDEKEERGAEEGGEKTESSDSSEQEQEEDENSAGGEMLLPAGEVRDSADGTEGEQNRQNNWEEALLSAASQAEEMGSLPEGIARLVGRQFSPQLDWHLLLARFIERNSRTDYTWLRPNRRYLHLGLYFPSLLDDQLQQIVVPIDTSGSVDEEILARFSAELSGIMAQMPLSLHIFCCDAAVQSYHCFEKADLPIEITPKGGGGTDFRPVFAAVAEKGITPACLIYLTDMQCLLYPETPPYPVLWVKSGGAASPAPPAASSLVLPGMPPFGEIITMDENLAG